MKWAPFALGLCVFAASVGAQDQERALEPIAPAQSAGAVRALIEEGNQKFAQGDFAGALERYRGARAGGDPETLAGVGGVEAAYNEAVALYALGEMQQAKDLLAWVEASPDAGRLAAVSRFNQGVIEYEQAMEEIETFTPQSAQEKIDQLRVAERDFRRSVDFDGTDAEAQKNLELTRREINRWEQMKQISEEMSRRAQELAENLEEAAEQQQSEAQENQNTAQQSEHQEMDQQQQDQQQLSERSESMQQDIGTYQSLAEAFEQSGLTEQLDENKQRVEDASEQLEQAQQAQQEAEQALEDGDRETAGQKQQEASEALQRAAERIREMLSEQGQQQQEPGEEQQQGEQQQDQGQQGQQGEQQQQEGEQGQQQQGQSGEQQTEESAAQQQEAQLGDEGEEEQDLAARIIEREERNREATRRAKGKNEPVEKDW